MDNSTQLDVVLGKEDIDSLFAEPDQSENNQSNFGFLTNKINRL